MLGILGQELIEQLIHQFGRLSQSHRSPPLMSPVNASGLNRTSLLRLPYSALYSSLMSAPA